MNAQAGPHTYIYRPGVWEISGAYYDKNSRAFVQKGRIAVTHAEDFWTIDSTVQIMTDEAQEVATSYIVKPPRTGDTFMEWKSHAGGPEPIFGLFVLVDDVIMMPWQSQTGVYWGQEVLVHITDTEYRSRGFAFLKNEKVSAWSLELLFTGA